jgi:hypothetical protein
MFRVDQQGALHVKYAAALGMVLSVRPRLDDNRKSVMHLSTFPVSPRPSTLAEDLHEQADLC